MIERPTDAAREQVARARRFAALSGPFDPRTLPQVVGDISIDDTLTVAADLAEACDTNSEAAGPTGRWLMRGTVRHRVLDQLAAAHELSAAIDWRRTLPLDESTGDLLDALTGSGALRESAVRHALAGDTSRVLLERIAVALDRAGSHAQAHDALDSVRSAVARLDARDRAQAMLVRGFFGREMETAKIADWLGHPAVHSPVKALFVSGLPGIGKSTLLDEAARRASTATLPWVIVRLDFDRAGLDVQDQVGLTMEITRQVSIELGDHAADLRRARLVAAGAEPSPEPAVKGERREQVPEELSAGLGEAVLAAGRPILLILDTLEVLRGRGETHPGRLFDCLDQLCDRGLRPLAIIAAGRGDALDSAPTRIGRRLDLGGLDPVNADRLLERLEVPQEAFADIRELAEGNPLVLRLAAMAVQEAGPGAIRRAKGRQEVAAAYLYRFLLSRLPQGPLRRLAQPGLVVRRIHPDVIAELLAPQLRLGRITSAEATDLFDRLATHHWLVEPDPAAPGWVRHRADIRAVLLKLLYRDRAATAARIDRAAAKWFAHRPESFAPVESAYHQLQALRQEGAPPPSIDPQVLRQFDRETIAELPPEAQDLVHAARGERTTKFRAAGDGDGAARPDLSAAAQELEAILERGDVIEAQYLYDRGFADRRIDPGSPEADVARTFLWRAGRWRAATRSLQARDAINRSDGDLIEKSPIVAMARLEMRAENDFAGLVRAFAEDDRLVAYADDLRTRGLKGDLGSGALGFALLRAGVSPTKASWSTFNAVGAAAAVWGDPSSVPEGAQPLSSAILRLQTRVSPRLVQSKQAPTPPPAQPRLPESTNPVGAARLLAGLSPYASPAEALRRLDRGRRIVSHLTDVDFEVAEAGGLPPSGAGDWSVAPAASPDGSIESLASLGLLAEWLGAAAFVLRHADLRLIGQSAEFWRRTTAGSWAYEGPRPDVASGWWRALDVTLEDRIAGLLNAPDPVRASEDDLRRWWGASRPDAERAASRIEERMPAAIRAARTGPVPRTAIDAAVELQRRKLPSAFVPGLSVLISLNRLEGGRST